MASPLRIHRPLPVSLLVPLYFLQHGSWFQVSNLLIITLVHCLSPTLDSEMHESWDFICFITPAVVDLGSGTTVHTWICVYTTASSCRALSRHLWSRISKSNEYVFWASLCTEHTLILGIEWRMARTSSIWSPHCLPCQLWQSEHGSAQFTPVWCHS